MTRFPSFPSTLTFLSLTLASLRRPQQELLRSRPGSLLASAPLLLPRPTVHLCLVPRLLTPPLPYSPSAQWLCGGLHVPLSLPPPPARSLWRCLIPRSLPLFDPTPRSDFLGRPCDPPLRSDLLPTARCLSCSLPSSSSSSRLVTSDTTCVTFATCLPSLSVFPF